MLATLKPYLVLATAILAACGGDDGNDTPNTAPTVGALTLSTDEDTPVSGNLVIGDAENDAVTITLGTAAHGTITRAANMITYTPEPNFHGTDSVEVTASDGTLAGTGTISITVAAVNDAPVAMADAFAAAEDTALALAPAMVLANDVDVDDDTLSVTAVGNATNGTVALVGGELVFTPAADFSGTGTFEYTASDGTATATATVTVTVGGANDAPVAVDDAVTTAEDVAAVVTVASLVANDTDAENQTLAITAVANATNGTVALAGTDVTFTPAANFNGAATFEYTVSDGAATDTGTVTVTVTPVNDAPVAVDDAVTTAEDTALVFAAADLALNDLDVDGDALAVTAVANPSGGMVALAGGQITFFPAANFSGAASFEYTVSDGTLTDTGSVTVTVTAVNDAPVAVDDAEIAESGIARAIPAAQLLANDTDIDSATLTISSVGNPTNGMVFLAGTTVTFISAGGFTGAATFEYTVSDGTATDTGLVNVTVIAPNTCGDGVVFGAETCDDNDVDAGDGCSATCTVEAGWTCTGAPSACTPTCGDGIVRGAEGCDDGGTAVNDGCSATCTVEPGWSCTGEPTSCTSTCGDNILAVGAELCDDGNLADLDGCTSACVPGVVCNATAFAGGDAFAVDATTGNCYAAFDDDMTTFGDAYAACAAAGGYLATITSAGEQALVTSVQNDAQNPWIGASEDGIDTDAVFRWVTGEAFGFTNFATGQPDDDANLGGNGECLHLVDAAGRWNDTNCDITAFVVGRICEIELAPCGDGVVQASKNEACDDGNTTAGDGCSATCTIEPLASFSFNGGAGDEVTASADSLQTTIDAAVVARGSGVSPAAGQFTFAANGWTQGTAIDVNDYFTLTVTPAAGVAMQLGALELDERRSGTGIRQWSVRSSLDNFAADLQVFAVPDDTLTRANQRVMLGAAFANLTAPIEFRIYGFAAEAAAGTWRIDNVELFGTATAP